MLDIKFIRENKDFVQESARKKKADVSLDDLIVLDDKRLELLAAIEKLRAEQNVVSDSIARGTATTDRETLIANMRELKERLKEQEEEYRALLASWQQLMMKIPNFASPDTPEGPDESGNRVIRSWGEKPIFDFTPRDHVDIGESLGIIDIETAAKVSGARFNYLRGDLALMQFALIQHLFRILTDEDVLRQIVEEAGITVSTKPFIPLVPPVFIRPEVFARMDRLEPKEDRYYIPTDDLYLIGSAEHTTGPIHMDSVIPEADLPIRYIAYSTAFRREAGSYGKDTRGILRVHQFDKLEMETFCLPEHSLQEQELLVAIQEYFLRTLKLPYEVMLICTGDMGKPDYRQIDINTWMPSQGVYRETHTADLMTSFQSRRLNTRVARESGKNEYVHMNDATACAIGRTLIAIIENYQQADGTIRVPDVLVPYLGKHVIGKANS